MRGFELVKREDHWALYNEDGHKIAATLPGCNSKLSIKNCEAIANGYDLDEKIINHLEDNHIEASTKRVDVIKSLILEILGDKKFSEDDIINAHYQGVTDAPLYEVIQSLQQTEWDVEIEMESKDIDELRVGKGSFLKPNDIYKPKLDTNGCLILRRI